MNGDSDAGSADRRDRPSLSGTGLVDFLVVAQVGEHFMESRRPLLPFFAAGLTTLLEVGHVTPGDSGSCGTRPVWVPPPRP